jgi:hypothetical protein
MSSFQRFRDLFIVYPEKLPVVLGEDVRAYDALKLRVGMQFANDSPAEVQLKLMNYAVQRQADWTYQLASLLEQFNLPRET